MFVSRRCLTFATLAVMVRSVFAPAARCVPSTVQTLLRTLTLHRSGTTALLAAGLLSTGAMTLPASAQLQLSPFAPARTAPAGPGRFRTVAPPPRREAFNAPPPQVRPAAPAPLAPRSVLPQSAFPRNLSTPNVRGPNAPSLQPATFVATAQAAERYAAIADAGGFPKVRRSVTRKSKGAHVLALRKRLAMSGDLDSRLTGSPQWDKQLGEAIKKFQRRVGLRPNGYATGATLKELNVPARLRFRQLASSAKRIANMPFLFGRRYIVINIPSAQVEAVENGRVVRRYTAILGKTRNKSPQVTTRVVAVNINPTWTVPTSIIKNEFIPKMRRNPAYLSRMRMKLIDRSGKTVSPTSINWSGTEALNYTFRQDSGRRNALGTLRLNMPNKHAVYMHDTPSKGLFRRSYRFLSHGCARVKGVHDLAAWLLEGNRGWSKKGIMRAIAKGKTRAVRLAQPVPVIWIYMTGWASADGTVHFRKDVYKLDRVRRDLITRR